MSPSSTPAARYERFRSEVFTGLVQEPGLLGGWSEPMPELQLQSLWFAGEFGMEFTTVDGERVLVRDFGVWNSGPGPDFLNCAVLINGTVVQGPIELDPDVRDWERHGHGANADYGNVILHLYIHGPAESRAYTRTLEHREVPQVQLRPEMLADGFIKRERMAEARLGRCATPLASMGEAAVQSLIEASAQYRLQRKSKRLHQCVQVQGREQAVYQALAQALGYRSNQRPFTVLAQRLPVRRLLAEEPPAREALLFGVSGFLDNTPYDTAQAGTKEYLRQLWEYWWKQRSEFVRWQEPAQGLPWKIAGARPGNHPERRLGALAGLLQNWSKIFKPLKHADAWDRQRWCEVMASLHHEYWDKHYTLSAAPSNKPVSMIGESRVNEILANVVYPLLFQERPAVWQEYRELPALLDNQKVRRSALRLFGESPLARVFQRKLHHQQGLLQIYEDFCLEDDSACLECPFPERLAQWQ
ncbi:MAG: hypothetical protein JWO89_740 [Verrucomicrobiaceae bacterium]|nr:hypothetical protein [Verrucomicrobiaceae bacterium]